MKGYVYVLTNECMPGIVKVGRTTRTVGGRAGELFQTGVPMPFKVAHFVATPDCVWLERWVHAFFQQNRVAPDREFFRSSVEQVSAALVEGLREQMDAMVAEYTPHLTLTDAEFWIDPGDVATVCHLSGVAAEEFALAFDYLDPSAIHACVEKRRNRAPHHWDVATFGNGGLLN